MELQSLRLLQMEGDNQFQVTGNLVEWNPQTLNSDPEVSTDVKCDKVNCDLLKSIAKCVRHDSNLVTDADTHTPLHTFRMVHIVQVNDETHTAQLIQVLKDFMIVGGDTNTTLLVYIIRIRKQTKLVFLTKQKASATNEVILHEKQTKIDQNQIARQIMENWSNSRPMKYFLCATRMFVEMGQQIKNNPNLMNLAYVLESEENTTPQEWKSGCDQGLSAEQYFPML